MQTAQLKAQKATAERYSTYIIVIFLYVMVILYETADFVWTRKCPLCRTE